MTLAVGAVDSFQYLVNPCGTPSRLLLLLPRPFSKRNLFSSSFYLLLLDKSFFFFLLHCLLSFLFLFQPLLSFISSSATRLISHFILLPFSPYYQKGKFPLSHTYSPFPFSISSTLPAYLNLYPPPSLPTPPGYSHGRT